MLKVEGLKKKYGKHAALSGLDMNVKKGAVYGLVGPNGAGKTTAIRLITGLSSVDEGKIIINGIDARKNSLKVKETIGYVPDNCGSYFNMSVSEYMEFFAAGFGITGVRAAEKNFKLLEQVGLEDKADFLADTLSRGMQQRLSLARALIHNPEFIIMDEPTSGLDPRNSFEFKRLVKELKESGKTVLISSHLLSELSEICTDIAVIENGKMVAEGGLAQILGRIEHSNPIKIVVLGAISSAMAVFKENSGVKTVSRNDNTFMIKFEGGKLEEARLLYELIEMEVPVCEFVRETGSLESFFIQITNHDEERVLIENDY